MPSTGLKQLYGEQRKLRIPLPGNRRALEVSQRTARRAITAAFVSLLLALTLMLLRTLFLQYDLERRDSHHELELLATLAAKALDSHQRADTPQPPAVEALPSLLPPQAFERRRVYLLLDAAETIAGRAGDGAVLATLLPGEDLPEEIRRGLGAEEKTARLVLTTGDSVLAASHHLSRWPGRVVVMQPESTVLLGWDMTSGTLLVIFSALAALGIGVLAMYNHQADRTEASEQERIAFSNRLDTALLLGRCGLWDWDVARGRIHLSSAMRQLLGLPERDDYMDIGAFLDLQHPEDSPVDHLLERMLEEGRATFEHEMRLRDAGGNWLWFKIRGALSSENGTHHLVGIAVDITAQKRAAAAMRAAEKRLMDAIESISESFVLWDDQMRLVLCNSKFREFHGLPEEACRAQMPHEQIMRQARTPRRIHKAQSIPGDTTGQEITWELELANGRWLKISERRISGGGYVSVGTDITELKNKQMALEHSEQELQETVKALEQARHELQERNLRLEDMARRYLAEKQRAEAEARHKTRFLAHMSHELRTPLGPVVSMSEALANGMLGELDEKTYRHYAADIHHSARRVLEMIDELLAYADIESGKVKPRRETTPLSTIITQVADKYHDKAREKGIRLSREILNDVEARVDAQLLAQALDKIVANAINFTSKGEICLRLHLAGDFEADMDNAAAVIEVRDTGCGMPPEKVEELMRPFERLGDAYQAHQGGTGLGLAIARALLAMHGGRLVVKSREGEGTTVRFLLPGRLVRAAHPQAAE